MLRFTSSTTPVPPGTKSSLNVPEAPPSGMAIPGAAVKVWVPANAPVPAASQKPATAPVAFTQRRPLSGRPESSVFMGSKCT